MPDTDADDAQNTVSDWFTNIDGDKGKSAPPDARVKLTTPAKEEIVRRIEAGEKQEQIASDYGVCPATVTKVKQAAERAEKKAEAVRDAASGGDAGPPTTQPRTKTRKTTLPSTPRRRS